MKEEAKQYRDAAPYFNYNLSAGNNLLATVAFTLNSQRSSLILMQEELLSERSTEELLNDRAFFHIS